MRARTFLLILLLVALALPALAQRRQLSPFQFVLEGGAALPYGDLADPFIGTEKGLGAGTGYALGARLRYYLGPTTSVGPSFHYVNFSDWNDITQDGTPYSVRTSLFRYGVDIQQFLVPRGKRVRPYLTLGGALVHKRYQDWLQGDGTFDASANSLSFALGGGLAMGPVEVSLTWNYNPTELRQLVPQGDDSEFDWSYLMVAAGLALGR